MIPGGAPFSQLSSGVKDAVVVSTSLNSKKKTCSEPAVVSLSQEMLYGFRKSKMQGHGPLWLVSWLSCEVRGATQRVLDEPSRFANGSRHINRHRS